MRSRRWVHRTRTVRVWLVAAGAVKEFDDVAHLTWDELLAPPPELDAIVERRRAEHDRLGGLSLPATISVVGADSALVRA
jgi:hypothetical protein